MGCGDYSMSEQDESKIVPVRCTMCNWSGMAPDNELDDACPGCGEHEALFEFDPEE